jgi:hypothetical protein
MTPEQHRIDLLEYQLHGLRRDVSMFALFGFAIVPNLLGLVPLELDFPKRLIVGVVLTLAFLYVRRQVLNARQAHSAASQRQQDFIESVPELNKNP